jgi:hypothetical protein
VLVLLSAITVVLIRLRRHRSLLVGWLFFLIGSLPVIGLIQAGTQIVGFYEYALQQAAASGSSATAAELRSRLASITAARNHSAASK